MKTAAILAVLFLAFAAAGTSDYQIAVDMAAERAAPVMIAAEGARP